MSQELYTYRCEVVRVVDGDTLDLRVDLGLRVFVDARVRLVGVNTPEIYGVEKTSEEFTKGMQAKRHVDAWIVEKGPNFLIHTQKDQTGKYGRWLGTLMPEDNTSSLNTYLDGLGYGER